MSRLTLPSFIGTGIVPLDWKKAFVVPIYKKGDCSSPENYCPISLTCVVCETLEHIISTNIHTHLNRYNIINMALEVEDHVKLN